MARLSEEALVRACEMFLMLISLSYQYCVVVVFSSIAYPQTGLCIHFYFCNHKILRSCSIAYYGVQHQLANMECCLSPLHPIPYTFSHREWLRVGERHHPHAHLFFFFFFFHNLCEACEREVTRDARREVTGYLSTFCFIHS